MGLCAAPAASAAALGDNFDLSDAVLAATASHPSVRAARNNLDAVTYQKEQLEWQRYPSVSAQTEKAFSSRQPTRQFRIDQPLWTGGRVSAEIDAAQSRVVAAVWSLQESRYSLAQRVIAAWRSLLVAQALTQASDLEIERLQVYKDMMLRRVAAQISPSIETELISARLIQARIDKAAVFSQKALALERLAQTLGEPLNLDVMQRMLPMTKQRSAATAAFPTDALSTVKDWVEKHPSVQKALADAEASKNDALAAESKKYPDIIARYQYQPATSTSLSQTGFAVVLNYQPGAGLSALSQAKVAASRYNAQLDAVDIARRDVAESVFVDAEEYRDANARENSIRESIEKSQTVLDSYARLFVAGRRTWIDVLNAARELSQNEKALATVQAQIITSSYQVRMKLGQLPWQAAESSP